MLAACCSAAMLLGVLDAAVPDRIAVRGDALAGTAAAYGCVLPEEDVSAALTASGACFRTTRLEAKLFGVLPIKNVDVNVFRDVSLIPGGMPFGVKLYSGGVVVIDVGEVACISGAVSPARDAGIRADDVIRAVNGSEVHTVEEVAALVHAGGGETMTFAVTRDGSEMTFDVTPVLSAEDGKYRAGLFIRDSTAGIGTVTYVEPETACFAGLGHAICDGETGKPLPLSRGTIVNVTISGVIRGQAGFPGELKGYFSSGKIGTLFANNECGVYGVFAELPQGCGSEAVPIALAGEITEGGATVRCTTDGGGVRAYTVNISGIDRSGRGVKNFIVTVTDPALLERTGGIVQGMSGSPILQNGRIVGAVTHVLVNDPTTGYGIFIENMLDAAG